MLDKLILFVVHWIIIYFIIYCLIIYFISKLNKKDDNDDNNKRLLDFIWKCKYDFFKHTRLISLTLVITVIILKILF